jgi:hypothetical protein
VQYEGGENYVIHYFRIYKIIRPLNHGSVAKTDTVPPFLRIRNKHKIFVEQILNRKRVYGRIILQGWV